MTTRGQHLGIDWDAQPLGREPDRVIAQRLGCHESGVGKARRRRGIAAVPKGAVARMGAVAELGTATDPVVARRLGLSLRQVQHARLRRGIPAPRAAELVDWAEHGHMLGTTWDAHVAQHLGVTNSCVSDMRIRRGIAAYTEARRCACGTAFVARHPQSLLCSRPCQIARASGRQYYRAQGAQLDCHVALMALKREVHR